jgi:hypothetical protein
VEGGGVGVWGASAAWGWDGDVGGSGDVSDEEFRVGLEFLRALCCKETIYRSRGAYLEFM